MKKGEMMGVLVIIILGAVAVIMIAIYVSFLKPAFDTEFTENECKASLQLTKIQKNIAEARDRAIPLIDACTVLTTKPVKLSCNRDFFFVDGTRVRKDTPEGEDVTSDYDDKCPSGVSVPGNNCLPENVLAEEMARCWEMMFRGQEALFSQAEVREADLWSQKGVLRTCFVCSEVTVHRGLESDRSSQENDQWIKYLDNAVYKEVDDRPITYMDFFNLDPKPACSPSVQEIVLDYGYPYNTCWNAIYQGLDGKTGDGKIFTILSIASIVDAFIPGAHVPDVKRQVYGWPSISYGNEQAGDGKQTYAITYVRRGMGSCEGVKQESKDSFLTNSIQAIPADLISNYCNTVVV